MIVSEGLRPPDAKGQQSGKESLPASNEIPFGTCYVPVGFSTDSMYGRRELVIDPTGFDGTFTVVLMKKHEGEDIWNPVCIGNSRLESIGEIERVYPLEEIIAAGERGSQLWYGTKLAPEVIDMLQANVQKGPRILPTVNQK